MKIRCLILLLCYVIAGTSVLADDSRFHSLAYDAVIVEGKDGIRLTKKQILHDARIFMDLMMNKQRRKRARNSDFKRFRRYCLSASGNFIEGEETRRYAARNGITPQTEQIAYFTRMIEKLYGAKSERTGRMHTIADLRWMLGPDRSKRLDAEIEYKALYVAVTNHIIAANSFDVSPVAVSNRLEMITCLNRTAQSTNDLIFARATNIWKRITAGEISFGQAATNYSEDANIDLGCEWGQFSMDDLADDPEVLKLSLTMKPGDISAPVESDNGLAILRMDPCDNPKHRAFSRVFFRLPMFYRLETPDEARNNLLAEYKEDKIKETLKAIGKELEFRYPNGEDLFDKEPGKIRFSKTDFEQ